MSREKKQKKRLIDHARVSTQEQTKALAPRFPKIVDFDFNVGLETSLAIFRFQLGRRAR
jgi:hypothetical protein